MALLLLLFLPMASYGMPASSHPGAARKIQPNIVFILADDLGYGDLSCQNPASKIRTPRLDRLAGEGTRFTDAHAPSALCTPSRYSILTGQNCWRSRLKSGVLNMWDEPLIASERLTVAGMLRQNGYRTVCFGKWHLGIAWPFVGTIPSGFDVTVKSTDLDWTRRLRGGPVDCGFDYYFGINIPNEPPYAFIENDHLVGVPTVDYPTVAGQQGHWAGPGVAGWDWAQALPELTTNTVRWIQAAGAKVGQPFFLYAPLIGPHQPVLPTASFQGSSQAGAYGDYVQELDWAVGQLLDALEATGAATNTLVIFSSDNGPDEFAYARLQQYQHASMGVLRGIKSDIWEGGHRVPFLARWPGNIQAGTTNEHPICLVDFMRTIADVAGAHLPPDTAQDSVSFLSSLLGKGPGAATDRMLVLESGLGQFGIRSNNWMYIDSGTGDGHNPELEPLWFTQTRKYVAQTRAPALLYDLSEDLGQGTNLLSQKPDIAGQLQAALRSERASYTWSGGPSGDWGTLRNWLPAGVPAGADILYTNVAGLANLTQTFGGKFSINSVTLDQSVSGNIRISAGTGGSLAVANGITMGTSTANLTLETPLTLSQSQIWEISTNHELAIGGPLALQGYRLTICGRGDVFIGNSISGAGSLTIRSSGTTILVSSNSFRGGTELSGGGFLVAQDNRALGVGGLVIPNNSTLEVAPGVNLTNAAVVRGFGAETNGRRCGAISVRDAGIGVYSGPVRLSGDTGVRANASGSILVVAGRMIGDADVTVLPGAGITLFRTNQFYTGRTIVEGLLRLDGGPNRLPRNTDVVLANSNTAELDLNGNDQAVASISGGGGSGGNIALGSATLTIAPTSIVNYSGSMSGKGNLDMVGPGTLILSGSNTYTGRSSIYGGTFVVNGALGNTEVIAEGGTLAGNGLIAGPVTIADGGVLAPTIGAAPLTVNNQLALSSTSVTRIDLDAVSGKSSSVQGLTSVTYAGLLLVSNVAPFAGFTNGQAFHLFSSVLDRGNFSQIEPSPGPGLVWRFDPNRGVLSVIAAPLLTVVSAGTRTAALSWPGHGFHLQVLTNSFGFGGLNEWVDYPGGRISPVTLPIDPRQRNVFFRLVNP